MTYREQESRQEADRSVLVVGLKGRVFGLSREDGSVLWQHGLPGAGAVYLGLRYGALVVSADDDHVHRLDYLTGQARWTAATSSAGRATIVIEADCIIVAKGGYLDCFAHDGKLLWKQPLTGMGMGRVAMGFPGNVAQADDVGR